MLFTAKECAGVKASPPNQYHPPHLSHPLIRLQPSPGVLICRPYLHDFLYRGQDAARLEDFEHSEYIIPQT